MNERHTPMQRLMFTLKFLEIRLRFVVILLVTALVVGYWDLLQNYAERGQRMLTQAAAPHQEAAHEEYEYTCAMHPFVVRSAPGKCPICGMDLIKRKKGAIGERPADSLARVQLSPERIAQAGIRTEKAAYRVLSRELRTYGTVEAAETKLARIIARFPGRVDELFVNSVGATVKLDEPLARIYSPKFLSALEEYRQTLKALDSAKGGAEHAQAQQLAEFARKRLLLAGFTEAQLDRLMGRSAADLHAITLYSPLSGTVLARNVVQGDAVEEGSALYTIADLSTVWVQAEVAEADIGAIAVGSPVEVQSVSYPGEIFHGNADFVYPTLNTETRTIRVRVSVSNAALKLKPGMYVTAILRSPVGALEALPAGSGSQPPAAAAAPTLPTQNPKDVQAWLSTLEAGAVYYECPMDTDVVSNIPAVCPKCGMNLEERHKDSSMAHQHEAKPSTGAIDPLAPSNEEWIEGYACPMHLDELASEGGACTICGCGEPTRKVRRQRVLSVPERAVIDTGNNTYVYVESSPGVFDARAVKLAARTGSYYPVLSGLKAGETIAAQGAFLIDAEARLNPQASGMGSAPPAAHQHAGH